MKKILLALGSITAVTAPITGVIACSDKNKDDKTTLQGHKVVHLGDYVPNTNRFYFDLTKPSGWAAKLSEISPISFPNVRGPQGYETSDGNAWGLSLDVEFDYKLKLNNQNPENVFYLMDLSNIKLVDQAGIEQKIINGDLFISNGDSFAPRGNGEEISYATIQGDTNFHHDEGVKAEEMRTELESLNNGKYEKAVRKDMIQALESRVDGANINTIAIKVLEKYITDLTPIKSREDKNNLDITDLIQNIKN